MLLRSLADDEYWSEYGVMVVVDGPGGDDAEEALNPALGLDGELLTVFATDPRPGGTVAHAGAGWVWGRVGWMDSYHVVRLEAHDAPPADDRGDWEEAVETPYWSNSGTVMFSTLTGGWDPEAGALELGPPGLYRVRVSCVRDFSQSRADEYRPLRTTPPGFARPVSAERGDGDGTFEEGDIWRLQFWPSPADAGPPRWLARFEPVTDPAGEEPRGLYPELATDLIAVALWTPGGAVGTLADLAGRLLASPGEVRAALETAVAAGHLRVTGDLAGGAAPLVLTPLPVPPPDPGAPQLLVMEDLPAATATVVADEDGDRVSGRMTPAVRITARLTRRTAAVKAAATRRAAAGGRDHHRQQGTRGLAGGHWYDPPVMTVTDVSGPSAGALTSWPIPAGCATEPVSGRRPVWEDATHILLAVPYGTQAPAIRVDARTGAIERLRLDRRGRGEQGQYDDGTEFDVEGFVEPFR
jgi:hypothetical protein